MTRVEKSVEVAERRTRALELRAKRYTYQQIADEMGYGSRQEAHIDIQRALAERRKQLANAVDELRDVESMALDNLEREALDILRAEHPVIYQGIVIHGVSDPAPKLAAIDRLLKIAQRRAKLLGLDAPTRIEQTGSVVSYIIDGMTPAELFGGPTTGQ